MMDDNSEYLSDNFRIELDNAVRKSWSESQCERESSLRESPMGTPTNQSLQISSSSSNFSSNRVGSSPTNLALTSDDKIIDNHPVERHYSLTENIDESISDILLDIDLGASELDISAAVQMNRPASMRRNSIQDVQRVRQLLNPRSSFSGASSQEPQLLTIQKLCWVTILPDDHPELISSIIVLNKSLLAVNSKYKLYVLHGDGIKIDRLENAGLKTLNYCNYLPEQLRKLIHPCSRLILFIVLEKMFDLVCYLSPTCMLLENADELLDSDEIAEEIDNDTCLLLSNELPNGEEKDEDIQVLILRPSSEVAMCITEFFTVYGIDEDDRRGKIASMNDCAVLKTLFDETWGHLSSDEYCLVLNENRNEEGSAGYKIVNFGRLRPWDHNSGGKTGGAVKSTNPTIARLLMIWKNFAYSTERTESM